ncbi:MAG: hypothetical protein R3C03_24125 [Pirellulaceae bacterium]
MNFEGNKDVDPDRITDVAWLLCVQMKAEFLFYDEGIKVSIKNDQITYDQSF